MRRRRSEPVALPVPEHLRIGSDYFRTSPESWKSERLAYGREHRDELRTAGVTPLDWIREGRTATRSARGLEPWKEAP